MHIGSYRVSVERGLRPRPSGSARRPHGVRVRGAVAAAVALVAAGVPTTAAFAATSSGTANFSLNTAPQVRSLTVSQSVTSFGACIGGNSTATALGFPNGSCFAGTIGSSGGGFVQAVSITNTGEPGTIDVNGQNAVPSDAGTPWTLCTDNVTGPTLCGSNSNPGQDQYGMFSFAQNERAGVPNLLNNPACDIFFDVTTPNASTGCTASTGQVGNEGFQLQGPSASTDTSSAWTISVTWTAAPPS